MVDFVPAVDLLYDAVKAKGHVCIGLDTCAGYVPERERRKAQNDAQAVLAFNKAVIDATYDAAACYKVQIAYYEEMGLAGLGTYSETLKYIRSKGSLVIADIKRGDIADTALRYANAHFSGDFEADFVTLSPYMGMDSIEPWLSKAVSCGKGAFVLVRTSNPGRKDFQLLKTSPQSAYLYEAVGEKLSELAKQNKGKCGYGIFGAVTGCAERDEALRIRQQYPELFFLIPGYGAQGGGAKDAVSLLRNGNGGVVNASRSIITAWQNAQNYTEQAIKDADNNFASGASRAAVLKMRDEILSYGAQQ
ncbi:MAG: orotidine-5'-phosphate decarboxylase [Treponema sp.]|jgi:orotidine-5'-phosphate decarboxylase|nr:orotidine-5'-phosphate decarboxylase [Treponema sp.]